MGVDVCGRTSSVPLHSTSFGEKRNKKKKKSVIRGKRIREKTDTRFIKVLYPFSIVEEDLLESYEKFN